ncbi:DNA cytosine methyltransferase [Yersinia mollaretii]|uniref:DNA cytosine methyltransferase n=1 Tax=Yersinia mollaretii TaxID=33060 RepID=UPI001427BDE3|nr:DNA cytosine methyltransferase [Yersinia mollaretii]MDA5536449.1 DNA cytosine methyltransferase [Yersinia mollaretii]NIL04177.1 DNA cytosine methyltransferase [Yersinia mollaretii]
MTKGAYYNEIDPYAAQWLRNLIKAGHIAPGYVDERSIVDVKPEDLTEFTQCHFFAGIGVWSLALRNAGWPDDKPVWTGSCPCQPFSTAGNQLGCDDERHLAPVWLNLIAQCQPTNLFGEQVAAAIGKHWLDDLFNELENQSYACGAAVLPACSVGAPHLRQRLWFVASKLADAERQQREECLSGLGKGDSKESSRPTIEPSGLRLSGGMVNTKNQRLQRLGTDNNEIGRKEQDVRPIGLCDGAGIIRPAGPVNGFWSDADWLLCRDGKWRPVEPGTFPLANGITNRVGRLRAYGNAINASAAEEFIRAYLATPLWIGFDPAGISK